MLWLLAALVLAGVYLTIRGFFLEPHALQIERVEVELPEIAPHLTGARLLHLTDIHIRSGASAKQEQQYHKRLMAMVSEAAPDVILLTGDYSDTKPGRRQIKSFVSQLKEKAPVLAVLGDNDLEEAAVTDEIVTALRAGGAQVLRQEGRTVPVRNGAINFVGIDDPRCVRGDGNVGVDGDDAERADAHAGRRLGVSAADLAAVMEDLDPAHPTVLLSHTAEIYPAAKEAGIDLLLSGHTHGGQVCLPLWGALYTNDRLGRRFASGMKQVDSLQMHVGRGVGWAKMQLRLFCPPEITLLLLH